MSGPNLVARPLTAGAFVADHRDPDGALWGVCAHANGHPTPELALRCARLTLDDAAVALWRTHATARGESGEWGDVEPAEADAWRLVALAARHLRRRPK